MLKVVEFAATCDHPILLLGETGAGKTYLAREIHGRGRRADRPFVRVNCAAIPDTLFEREMFGHVRGAFTDAREAGLGFFETAHTGTLFLDEIGEIAPVLQSKLLAVLEEGCFRRLGSPRETRVDVRVIAATNGDLPAMVRRKQFREDLFYRLSVMRFTVPPLREHPEEIPGLVQRFLARVAPPEAEPLSMTSEALEQICRYPWPGNIRELENALRAAAAFSHGGPIQPFHLPREVQTASSARAPRALNDASPWSARYAAPGSPDREAAMIRAALEAAGGNKTRAARSLGMSRSTLWAKLQRHDLAPLLRAPREGG
jgi:DNA-binding NtrC family response regulator